jgi:hypothetical protein
VSKMTAPSLQDRLRALYATHPLIIEAADALDALEEQAKQANLAHEHMSLREITQAKRIAALEAALREAIQCLDYVQRSHPGTTGIARRLGAISDGNTLLGPTGDNHG